MDDFSGITADDIEHLSSSELEEMVSDLRWALVSSPGDDHARELYVTAEWEVQKRADNT